MNTRCHCPARTAARRGRFAGAVLGALSLMACGTPPPRDVDAVIAVGAAPPGVVFEIVGGEEEYLGAVLPGVVRDIKRLRARFPGLPVAVVSHGFEQFALSRGSREIYPRVHELAQELASGEGVRVEVCGRFAQRNGVDPGVFPPYVQVAATGPGAVDGYRQRGYVLLVIAGPS